VLIAYRVPPGSANALARPFRRIFPGLQCYLHSKQDQIRVWRFRRIHLSVVDLMQVGTKGEARAEGEVGRPAAHPLRRKLLLPGATATAGGNRGSHHDSVPSRRRNCSPPADAVRPAENTTKRCSIKFTIAYEVGSSPAAQVDKVRPSSCRARLQAISPSHASAQWMRSR